MSAATAGAFAGLLLNLAEEHERALAEAVSHSAHDLKLKNAVLRQEIQELKQGSGKWLECMRCRDERRGADGADAQTPAQQVLKLAREELSQAVLKYRRQVPANGKGEDASKRALNAISAPGCEEELSPRARSSVPAPPKRSFVATPMVQAETLSSSSVKRKNSFEEARRTSKDSLESIPECTTVRRASQDSIEVTRERFSLRRSSQDSQRQRKASQEIVPHTNNTARRVSKDSLQTTKERLSARKASQEVTEIQVESDSPTSDEDPDLEVEANFVAQSEGSVDSKPRAPTPPPAKMMRRRDEAKQEGKRNSRLQELRGGLVIDTNSGRDGQNGDASPKEKRTSILKDRAGNKSCSFHSEASAPSSPRGQPPPLEVPRKRSLQSVCFSDDNESICGSPGAASRRGASRKAGDADGIKLHNVWKRGVSFAGPPQRRSQHSERSEGFLRRSMRKSETAEAMMDFAMHAPWFERTFSRFVSHPGSPKRVFWDLLGIFLVGQEVVLFPFQVFGKNENLYTSWFTTLYWTVSIPLSFFVGFQSGGIIEMRPKRIAEHYAKSWLSFDVLVVSLDWALSIAGMVGASAAAQGSIGSVRFLKVLRFLRVARLLRLWKVRGVINDLIDRVQSEAFLIFVGIVKLIVMIVLVNHLIACMWYGIGTLDEGERNWLYANMLSNEGIWYRYFTSLHWSLTQFTPASMEVVPQNVWERTFAVCVLLFAMVTFSSFISSITNAMTQLRNLNAERNHQLSVLRQYLTQNHISGSLTVRIWGCVQKAVGKSKKRIHEPDVLMMQALPWQLRMDVLEEIYAPLLGKHPFFLEYGSLYGHQVRRIYENAVQEVSLAMGQKLFTGGEVASSMFFILTGVSSYTRDSVFENELPVELIDQWVCEAVLWLKWKHNGQFVAKSHAEFVGVVATEFHVILKDNRHAIKYARNFAAYFKKYPEYLSDAYSDIDSIKTIVTKAFTEEAESCDAFGKVLSNKSMQSQKSQKVIQTSINPLDRRRRSSFGGILQALKMWDDNKVRDENDLEKLQQEFTFKASVDSAESQVTSGTSDDGSSDGSSGSGLVDSDEENGIGSPSPLASPLASVDLAEVGHHGNEAEAGNGKAEGRKASLADQIESVMIAATNDPKLSNILPEVKSTRKVSDGDVCESKLARIGSRGSDVQQAWH